MSNPAVSIIIPCYNGAAFVREALKSLQMQTFGDWEAVVVNDGSSDDSEVVIRKYCSNDARIHCVTQENRGLPVARNTGLSIVKGEFVSFLDADDLFMPEMLHKMVDKLRLDRSSGVVSCGWIYSDFSIRDLSWKIYCNHQGQLFEKLAHGNLFACHAVLLRRGILEQVGVFDCSLRHCHDWDLWLRVARSGVRFTCIPEPMVIYRMTPQSLSRNAATFYLAGKEVICRGHQPDPRVKDPDAQFIVGCRCSNIELPLRDWLIQCVGLAIAQGNSVQASALFESNYITHGNAPIHPEVMRGLTPALYYGSAIPAGNWDDLYVRVGRALLEFLLRQEERLGVPGFAVQSVLQMFKLDGTPTESNVESMNVRELIRVLLRKAMTQLTPHKLWR